MIRQVVLVTLKELRATVRDPHVLAYLLFPILLYPGMILGVVSLMAYRDGWEESASWRLDVQAPAAVAEVILDGNEPGSGGLEALQRGELDAVVIVEEDGDQLTALVHHHSTRPRSYAARQQVDERLRALGEERLEQAVERAGLDPDLLAPIEVGRKVKRGRGQLTRWLAAILLCAVVPVSMVIAGIYPAVELIVSERERKTIETTLVSPVSRVALLTGKVLAAVVLMLAAGMGNAGAVALTANQMVYLTTNRIAAMWLPPPSALAAVPVLVATGVLFAGANLLAVLPARTFKEGEYTANMLMTLVMMVLMAGLLGLVTGSAGPAWAWIPGTNSVLAIYYALLDEMTVGWVVIPTAVNLAAGAALIAVCARVLDREDTLFGDRLPRWLRWVRRMLPE